MNTFNPHIKEYLAPRGRHLKPVSYYVKGIVEDQDLYILSEAITLLESNQASHRDIAYQLLLELESQGPVNTLRIGITGSPGVGKSTFIEYLGAQLIKRKHRIAVLTIDPTSATRKGSILGDKTRMEQLNKKKDIFIRPSPSSLHLGGSHQYTQEAIMMCEAAGFDLIIIETVGVGQSEIEIAEVTDLNLLLLLPGGGDTLQGVKMGVMETADMIVVHKADGEQISNALNQLNGLIEALHIQGKDKVKVVSFSSLYPENEDHLLTTLDDVIVQSQKTKNARRIRQQNTWLKKRIYQHVEDKVRDQLQPGLEKTIRNLKESSQSQINNYLRIADRIHIEANISEDIEDRS